jgi:hypothetical protein
MEGLNKSFFFVVEKLFELQGYFRTMAWGIGRTVFTIALLSAALNYALTGEGLKENVIKLLKATVFFMVIMSAYPRIINWITEWTFASAYGAVGHKIEGTIITINTASIARAMELKSAEISKTATYGSIQYTNPQADALAREYAARMNGAKVQANSFSNQVIVKMKNNTSGAAYSTIAPSAALQSMLMVAGECIRAANEAPPKPGFIDMPDFGVLIAGYLCAFFVMFTGCFALLEYVMAFMEFVFITSVGVILFPMSMWEGSKFLTEKLISAIIGFTIKLLFSTMCIFLMLYGYLSLASGYVDKPFMGLADQIIMIIFTCLLFFYICKSAPGLAQSLLTGSPSLSAAGAIGAAASAVGAVGAIGGLAAHGAANLAGGAAKIAGGASTMAKQMSNKAGEAGGGRGARIAAGIGGGILGAAKSAGGGLLSTAGSVTGGLTRSLLAHSPLMPKGGGAGGYNRNSPAQMALQANRDGSQKTAGDFFKQSFDRGANPNEYKVAASDGRNQKPQAAAPAPAALPAPAVSTSVGAGGGATSAHARAHHRLRTGKHYGG